jgi:internalin A
MNSHPDTARDYAHEYAHQGLTHLAGLALPPTLSRLDLSLNELSTLADLPPLPALVELILNRNPLRDLGGLERAPALVSLSLSHTRLERLDALAGLKRLTALYARSVPYVSLAPLAALPLTTLALSVYDPAELEVLKEHPFLELHLTGAGLSALPPLRWGALHTLSLTHAPALVDVSALRAATALTRLSLAFTEVNDIDALASLSALTTLDLRGTPAAARPLPAWTAKLDLRLR